MIKSWRSNTSLVMSWTVTRCAMLLSAIWSHSIVICLAIAPHANLVYPTYMPKRPVNKFGITMVNSSFDVMSAQ